MKKIAAMSNSEIIVRQVAASLTHFRTFAGRHSISERWIERIEEYLATLQQ